MLIVFFGKKKEKKQPAAQVELGNPGYHCQPQPCIKLTLKWAAGDTDMDTWKTSSSVGKGISHLSESSCHLHHLLSALNGLVLLNRGQLQG